MRTPVLFAKKDMSGAVANRRTAQDVLRDRTGGMAAELGGVAMILVISSAISFGLMSDTKAIGAFSVKAERQALVSALADDKREGGTWGTKAAPATQTMTLENGHEAPVTLWRETTPVGTMLTAVAPSDAGPDAADCTMASDVEKPGCVYAQRFHAAGMDAVNPVTIIRKDPGTAPGSVLGTVDSRAGTTGSIPQGTVLASGTDAAATSWRYLVTARSLETSGEIRFVQAGRMLAVIPVASASNNYFGTFSAVPGVPVTATVSQGNVVVQTVMTYRAGGGK